MLDIMACGVSQINMPAVLVANGVGCCLTLVILFGKRRRIRRTSYDGKLFYWMCRFCLSLCVLETAGFLLDGAVFFGARPLNIVINVVILLLALILSFLWVCYVDYKLFSDYRRLITIYPLVSIPAVLLCVLSLSNIFIEVFFGVTQDNTYYRTPLFFIPWVVVYGYMTRGALLSYRYQKQVDKYLFMPVMVFLIPIYVGSLIQLLYYGISLIWVSVALGLTFLYLNLQNEEAYLDSLTQLYNRGYLMHYMDYARRLVKSGQRVTGIMVDINGFKHINDTCGHIAGDKVLRTVGQILLSAVPKDSVAVRFGGDEFVVILENATPERLQNMLDLIQQGVDHYNRSGNPPLPVSLSIGKAELNERGAFSFFQKMDQNMYQEKDAFYLRQQSAEADSGEG